MFMRPWRSNESRKQRGLKTGGKCTVVLKKPREDWKKTISSVNRRWGLGGFLTSKQSKSCENANLCVKKKFLYQRGKAAGIVKNRGHWNIEGGILMWEANNADTRVGWEKPKKGSGGQKSKDGCSSIGCPHRKTPIRKYDATKKDDHTWGDERGDWGVHGQNHH